MALLFSTIEVGRQAFYQATRTFAIVNIKPVVPGHVLVIPKRNVPRLTDLNDDELLCLIRSVKHVGNIVQKAYESDGLTIALQDGPAAGQTIPHVHFHILPRKLQGDPFSQRNDAIYQEVEKNEVSLKKQEKPVHVDAEESSGCRSMEEMEKEAIWLKGFFTE